MELYRSSGHNVMDGFTQMKEVYPMNEHSVRILSRIPLFLNKYRAGEITLSGLISVLEGSIDALEEKLPEEWMNKWIELVGNLEICSALGLESERKLSIIDNLRQLDLLILQITPID